MKLEENVYQHKCKKCGELFFARGKGQVTCDDCLRKEFIPMDEGKICFDHPFKDLQHMKFFNKKALCKAWEGAIGENIGGTGYVVHEIELRDDCIRVHCIERKSE